MSDTPKPGKKTGDVEIGAGGLVFYDDEPNMRIAVVHRSVVKGGDWVLPKGHQKKGEESYEVTALREVEEETGWRATCGAFLGSYAYLLPGRATPKVVLMWRMVRVPMKAATRDRAPKTEVESTEWLSPEEAVRRLSYANEREFVRQHCRARV